VVWPTEITKRSQAFKDEIVSFSYSYSVHTSQRTCSLSVTKTNYLILCRGIMVGWFWESRGF
jgi:hypothetical protein